MNNVSAGISACIHSVRMHLQGLYVVFTKLGAGICRVASMDVRDCEIAYEELKA